MKNLSFTGDLVLAEAAYILLSCGGEPDAHEIIRKITLESEKTGERMCAILKKNDKIWNTIKTQMERTIGIEPEEFFSHPELYRGLAAQKATKLAAKYKAEMEKLKK